MRVRVASPECEPEHASGAIIHESVKVLTT